MSKVSEVIDNLKAKFKEFQTKFSEETKLSVEFTLADGTNVEALAPEGVEEMTAPTVEALINEIKADGNTPLADGTYERDNGDVIEVAGGKIKKLTTKEELEAAAKGTQNAKTVEEQLTELQKKLEESQTAVQNQAVQLSDYKSREDTIKAREDKLKEKEEELNKMVQLAEEAMEAIQKTPAAAPSAGPSGATDQMSDAERAIEMGRKLEEDAKRNLGKK